MAYLIAALLLFLGGHSLRIFAEGWRAAQLQRLGALGWMALHGLVSLISFALLVWAYGAARGSGLLWAAPAWGRGLATLLTLAAFILIVAAYVPRNRLQARLGHPMALGVALWAVAHLLVHPSPAGLLLFGAFFAWACLSFRAGRGRDRSAGIRRQAGPLILDVIVAGAGVAVWGAFLLFLHQPLIGISALAG